MLVIVTATIEYVLRKFGPRLSLSREQSMVDCFSLRCGLYASKRTPKQVMEVSPLLYAVWRWVFWFEVLAASLHLQAL